MGLEFLRTLVIIFGVSAIVIFALHKLRIPSVVGFLVAGVFLGPHGFGFVKDIHEVELLAEVGVILLLFMIGLEISLKTLKRIRSAVLGGGFSQILLTTLTTSLIAYLFTRQWSVSILSGFLVSLSSTAIVMKMLFERGELDSPHGRLSMGILIFQDLCVVPLMLLIPILSGVQGDLAELLWTMFKSAIILFMVIVGARWLVPSILHQIVRTRSHELFVITIILLCLGTALLTSWLGLSLALGAFLAGLVISESEYAFQAISDILPFKESFNGLFFISVGMLMDLGFLATHPIIILLVLVLIVVLKTWTGFFSVHLLGHPVRVSFQTGLTLAQVGEFSFVLAVAARSSGLLEDNLYQLFLSSSILTMLLTPPMVQASPRLSTWFASKRVIARLDRMRRRAAKEGLPSRREGHVIIVGFGLNGRNLAAVLKETSIPYVVLEINNESVLEMKRKGEPIFYGDGTSPEILHKAGIATARLLVVVISDAASTRRIVQTARKLNPRVYIIVRTRYTAEVDDLIKLGANEVIPEEFETSIEIFAKVLHHYQIPSNVITHQVEKIRSGSYEILRRRGLPVKGVQERCDIHADFEIETYQIDEQTPASGQSLKDLKIHGETDATIVAVRRGEEIFPSPSPEFIFQPGDILYLIGRKEKVCRVVDLLDRRMDEQAII